jgi:hypothetical protein
MLKVVCGTETHLHQSILKKSRESADGLLYIALRM